MQIINITELRKWARENGFDDSWWFSIGGVTCGNPVKLAEVPREGQVLLLNAGSQNTDKEEWLVFRYPGYKNPDATTGKDKSENPPTIKQTLALEFFGETRTVTRKQASELLDEYFSLPTNYGRYQDFLWITTSESIPDASFTRKPLRGFKHRCFSSRKMPPNKKSRALLMRP